MFTDVVMQRKEGVKYQIKIEVNDNRKRKEKYNDIN